MQPEKNDSFIMEQVVWNKSSALLKNIFQSAQTSQLFTKLIKTEIICESY
jgi:hypothetical protein